MSPEFVNCGMCGNDQGEILLATEAKFVLQKCRECGMVFVSPRPTKSEILGYYPEGYSSWKPHSSKQGNGSAIRRVLRAAWGAYARLMQGASMWSLEDDISKGKVLDVGCGGGSYLKALHRAGWETYGVDISHVATDNAKKLGLNVFTGELREAGFKDKYFDVIIMKHTLEHFHNPLENLKEAHRILKDNGFLQVEVPNFGGASSGIFKKHWFGLQIPKHLYHFSFPTLRLTLRKSGFSIADVGYGTDPDEIVGSLKNLLTRDRATSFWEHFLVVGMAFPISAALARLKQGASIVVRARKKVGGTAGGS